MLGDLPPYALGACTFRFRALAAHAGRRPLGGEREIVLATLLGAHMATGLLTEHAFPAELRMRRAAAARSWLSSLALPASARTPLARLIETTGKDDSKAVREALQATLEAVGKSLDGASRREIEALEKELAAGG